MLELKKISHYYTSYNTNNKVLSSVDISFEKSSITTIFGNSGTGKTTLLNIAGLIIVPSEGQIIIDKQNINNSKNTSSIRLQYFGYVFQNHYLLPEFTIEENLILPGVISGDNKKEINNRVSKYLDRFGLNFIKNKYPHHISIGEAQRVAVIRSLINKPKIIIADEPTSNLDDENADKISNLFKELKEENKYAIVIATHDKRFLQISDNNYKLNNKNLIKL